MFSHIEEKPFLPELRDPVMIIAFSNGHKGGATGITALSHLIRQAEVEPLVELDAHAYYNYARLRPLMRFVDGERTIEWPRNVVHLVHVDGFDRDILLLTGVEPQLNWQGFASDIASFATRAGVRQAVVLHAAPAAVSHRMAPMIQALYSSESMQAAFGLPNLPLAEGPVDIGLVVNLALQQAGCETVDLFAMEPFYTPALPDARLGLALLQAIERAFGFSFEYPDLENAAEEQMRAIEAMFWQSAEMQEIVRGLEEAWHTRELSEAANLAHAVGDGEEADAEPLHVDSVLAEAERLLQAGRSGS